MFTTKSKGKTAFSKMALLILSAAVVSGTSIAEMASLQPEPATRSEVISVDQLQWGYLNPLRGAQSPGAADLWGDRTRNTETGMLVRFKKGFSSPPHNHNVSYRGVVIRGLMHNDDPKAGYLWMPTASYWTQPAGENHITAANGHDNLIYLEIDQGPYLVHSPKVPFDNGEKPLNIHRSNIVWTENAGSHLAYLWGSTEAGEIRGVMIKLPDGFRGKIATEADVFRAVVIQGTLDYRSAESNGKLELLPGSYFGSRKTFDHKVSVQHGAVVYLRTNGQFRVVPDN